MVSLTVVGQQTLYYIEVSFLSPAFCRVPILESYRKLLSESITASAGKSSGVIIQARRSAKDIYIEAAMRVISSGVSAIPWENQRSRQE